ncbi:MAG: flagellar basal-body MS-ring/collar protein FliF [Planctomycetia bacterium]|nr:flagellar basal-body MS-ring/collar protein FliF [Planctomycetia bacterium]
MSAWQRFMQQWLQVWQRLSPMGRVSVSGFSAAFLVLVVGVSFWASTTKYAVLTRGISEEEAAAIVQKLDADRVPYELSDGGTTIMVPTDRVLKVRLSLHVAGLSQGAGKGYELFDGMSMGTTPFVQNVNFGRAIEGELARTIMQLDPIATAKVHLVQPDNSVFIRDEKPVTASIVIKTKSGQTLTRKTSAGIVAFLASSVKGLTKENVTLLDSEGHELSERRDLRSGLASSDQHEYQREVEAELAANAQEILTRLLGPGQTVVRVTAEMSFKRIKEQSEKVDPDNRVAKRESITTSKSTGPSGPQGIAGAASNATGAPKPAPGSGTLKQDETTENEYAISLTKRQSEESQGTIERLTVAVILMPISEDPDADPEELLGITAKEATELVKQAVGFKEGRDQIQVSLGKPHAVESNAAEEAVVATAQKWQNYANVLKASALAIAALTGLVGVFMLFRSKPASNVQATKSNESDPSSEKVDIGAVVSTLKSWLGDSNQQAQPT